MNIWWRLLIVVLGAIAIAMFLNYTILAGNFTIALIIGLIIMALVMLVETYVGVRGQRLLKVVGGVMVGMLLMLAWFPEISRSIGLWFGAVDAKQATNVMNSQEKSDDLLRRALIEGDEVILDWEGKEMIAAKDDFRAGKLNPDEYLTEVEKIHEYKSYLLKKVDGIRKKLEPPPPLPAEKNSGTTVSTGSGFLSTVSSFVPDWWPLRFIMRSGYFWGGFVLIIVAVIASVVVHRMHLHIALVNYAVGGLLLFGALMFLFLAASMITYAVHHNDLGGQPAGDYPPVRTSYNQPKGGGTRNKSAKPTTSKSSIGVECVVAYTSGVCWTIPPPNFEKARVLPSDAQFENPVVNISSDGLSCTLIVPATDANGVEARDGSRSFVINRGDEYQITTENDIIFSFDHPRVGAQGMYGWHDPKVDSPFNQNVGGLEYAIGALSANRLPGWETGTQTAAYSGIPTFRVIERLSGYKDNNHGGFKVTIRIIRRA